MLLLAKNPLGCRVQGNCSIHPGPKVLFRREGRERRLRTASCCKQGSSTAHSHGLSSAQSTAKHGAAWWPRYPPHLQGPPIDPKWAQGLGADARLLLLKSGWWRSHGTAPHLPSPRDPKTHVAFQQREGRSHFAQGRGSIGLPHVLSFGKSSASLEKAKGHTSIWVPTTRESLTFTSNPTNEPGSVPRGRGPHLAQATANLQVP